MRYKSKFTGSVLKRDKYRNFDRLLKLLFPISSTVYRFYSAKLLKYINIGVYKFIKLKLFVFIGIFLLILLIKYTNIAIITDKILNNLEYRVELIYEYHEAQDAKLALNQEISNFQRAKGKISKAELAKSYQMAMDKIYLVIDQCGEELLIPRKTMASKIYNRLSDYYSARQMNFIMYLLYAILFSFCPELVLILYNLFVHSDAKRELKFLKKLMILNGNIKPVDFNEVLKILINKSKFYTSILKEIEEKNRSNSFDNLNIYIPLIKESKNIEEKLFFEKLDEANNYDFDQAIKNIENEFSLDKREVVRNIKKRIEYIHIIGLIGLMTIILVLTLYLIIPWMTMYNLNQFSY